jgi:mannose-6-phosphate isomerase
MSSPLSPLKFVPVIKPLPWGGRKLETFFHKELPAGVPCGESWEVVDLPEDQSVVAEGERAGARLADLIKSQQEELLGDVPLLQGRFPVLYKFIDVHESLSVQVHPDARAAQQLGHGARPKTEAWYVLHADPNAQVFLGFHNGVTRRELIAAIKANQIGSLLKPVAVHTGDFVFLPAGLVHAVGGGVMLAEIQQSSDTTFRIYDWGRMGLDGKPRTLHIEEALTSIDFPLSGRPAHATPLSGRPGVRCKYFTFERTSLGAGGELTLDSGRARIISCIDGAGLLTETGTSPLTLSTGETVLLPACRAGVLRSTVGGVFLLVRV